MALVLHVPREGLCEKEVFRALLLTSMQVYPLLGREIVHPRDYLYPSRPRFSTHYFTPSGVRKLAAFFRPDLGVEVIEGAPPPAPPAPHSPPPASLWWQKDNA